MLIELNCIDLLTIILKKEIIKFGIPYLKMVIKSIPDFKVSDMKNRVFFRLIFKSFSILKMRLLQLGIFMIRKLIDIIIFIIAQIIN